MRMEQSDLNQEGTKLRRTGPLAWSEGCSNHASLFIRGMREVDSFINFVQMIKWPHLPFAGHNTKGDSDEKLLLIDLKEIADTH